MMKRKLLIFGTNTTGKSIFKFVNNYQLFNIIGFAVDGEYKTTNQFCDYPVYDVDRLEGIFDFKEDLIFVAIQWNRMNRDRKNVYNRLKEKGFLFANIISPTAIIHGEIIGDNCWVSDLAIIDTHAKIGNNVFIKSKAYIANDCVVNDHCFIGANSFIAGEVSIGVQSFIGISATVFDQVTIGKKCLVGACTVVKRNLIDYSIVKNIISYSEVVQSTSEEIETKLVVSKNKR